MDVLDVKIGETEHEKKVLFATSEDWLAKRREEPIDPATHPWLSTPSGARFHRRADVDRKMFFDLLHRSRGPPPSMSALSSCSR
jgi:hypothetical protein